MKFNKQTSFFLAAACIMAGLNVNAQHVEKVKLKYDYIQLPVQPLAKNIKNCNSKVEISYEKEVLESNKDAMDKYKADLESYPKRVKGAEDQYNTDMDRYDQEVKDADAQYKTELDAYNKQSMGKKVADNIMLKESQKPQKRHVERPYKNIPPEPQRPVIEQAPGKRLYNKEVLAGTYLKLDGYNSGTTDAVTVLATIHGFESSTKLKTNSFTYYEKGSTTGRESNKYQYTIQYRSLISVKVIGPDGSVIFEEAPVKFSEYSKSHTGEFESTYALDDYWAKHQNDFLADLDDKQTAINMQQIHDLVNSKYGHVKVNRETVIYQVKEKKFQYPEYSKAYESAAAGYNLLADGEKSKQAAQGKFKEAIDQWEAAMKESQPADKKARIDEEITGVTLRNLIEAYIWTDDYTNADRCLNKLGGMDLSKKEKKWVDEMRDFMKDQKNRYEASKV
jgi:hypothetical protein